MGEAAFYYIMDYDGNYYRTDKAKQLVAAKDEKEAEVFNFDQANAHTSGGKKSAFYIAIPIEDDRLKEKENTKNDAYNEQEEKVSQISPIKELACSEAKASVDKSIFTYDLSEMDWEEYLTHFTYIASGISTYRDKLAKDHSAIEQKLCDILHYVELCETDDEEAKDLIELLRVCRENRRIIKDELKYIEYFQGNLGTSANIAKAKQALSSIKGMESRRYKPRKYEELFENCILSERKSEKSSTQAKDVSNDNEKMRFSINKTYSKEVGRSIMEEERYDTPFDEKENNWLEFARQQAQFYRNAGQYITNLQMDIDDIDGRIEEVLKETESANCNVTQGYRVFKQLKELRIERKLKCRELNCLYALTDYIDCEALADTCEENLKEVENIMNEEQDNEISNIQAVADSNKEAKEDLEDNNDKVG